jgi:hypothetical protein
MKASKSEQEKRSRGKPVRVHTEKEILQALVEMFKDRHCLIQPSLPGCRPDFITARWTPEFEVAGYEVKRSRPDWLTELRSGKNAEARLLCDRWYIVALEGVVLPNEMPFEWGLYTVVSGPNIGLVREATRTTQERFMPRDFASAILRCVASNLLETEGTQRAYQKGYSNAVELLLGWPHYGSVSGETLKAAIEALENRTDLRIIKDLEALRDGAANAFHSLNNVIKSLPPYKDWQTGNALPPAAEDYGKKVREHLTRVVPLQASLKDREDLLERLVAHHVSLFLKGKQFIKV